jgi:hypothetical protein
MRSFIICDLQYIVLGQSNGKVRWNGYVTLIWRREMLAKCKLGSLNATDHFRGLGVKG